MDFCKKRVLRGGARPCATREASHGSWRKAKRVMHPSLRLGILDFARDRYPKIPGNMNSIRLCETGHLCSREKICPIATTLSEKYLNIGFRQGFCHTLNLCHSTECDLDKKTYLSRQERRTFHTSPFLLLFLNSSLTLLNYIFLCVSCQARPRLETNSRGHQILGHFLLDLIFRFIKTLLYNFLLVVYT